MARPKQLSALLLIVLAAGSCSGHRTSARPPSRHREPSVELAAQRAPVKVAKRMLDERGTQSSDRRVVSAPRATDDAASQARPSPDDRGVVTLAVAFAVTNSNGSTLPCASDEGSYTLHGHLVAPHSAFTGRPPSVVTLYVHGFLISEPTWVLNDVPGYDHAAEMAKLGHVSVTIERIGWDRPRPNGLLTCTGSAADVAHQIVTQLRHGTYAVTEGSAAAFPHVVLAGFETGGAVAQVEAYSYKDIDGLIVVNYQNQSITNEAQQAFVDSAITCAQGGQDAQTDAPGGGYFAASQDVARHLDFYDAEPRVVDAVLAHSRKNPCGEDFSLAEEFVTGPARLASVTVPVLLVQSDHDKVFDPSGAEAQKAHYSGTSDVAFEMLAGTGHFPMFERSAPSFRGVLSEWLDRRW